MADGLKWLMSLEDKVSEPASTAEGKLAALERRLEALTRAEKEASDPAMQRRLRNRIASLGINKIEAAAEVGAERHARATESWVSKLDHGLGAYLKIFEIVGGLVSAVWNLGKGIANVVIGFASAGIEAAAQKEELIAQFRALTGSREAAIELADTFDTLTAKVKFTGDETATFARTLLAAGGEFTTQNVPTYLRALSDAAAATGASASDVEGAIDAMVRVNTTGRFTEKTMGALVKAGIPAGNVYRILARDLKTTEAAARDLVRAGKIGANEGLWAVVGGVTEGRSEGMLGSEGERYARTTIAGLRKNFEHFKGELFDDLFNVGGTGALKSFWANVNEAINPESATGKRVRGVLTSAFDRLMTSIFGPLSGAKGAERIEKMVLKIVGAVESLITVGRVVWNVFEGMVSGALQAFGLSVDDLFGADGGLNPEKVEALVAGARDLGESFGRFAGGVNKLVVNLLALGDVTDKLGSVNNWVLEKLGLGGGAKEPTNEEQGLAFLDMKMRLDEAVRAARPTASAASLAKGGARTSNRSAVVNVNVAGSNADPRAIGEAARSGTERGMASTEDLAFSAGMISG